MHYSSTDTIQATGDYQWCVLCDTIHGRRRVLFILLSDRSTHGALLPSSMKNFKINKSTYKSVTLGRCDADTYAVVGCRRSGQPIPSMTHSCHTSPTKTLAQPTTAYCCSVTGYQASGAKETKRQMVARPVLGR